MTRVRKPADFMSLARVPDPDILYRPTSVELTPDGFIEYSFAHCGSGNVAEQGQQDEPPKSTVPPPPELWQDFIALNGQSDSEIVAFAREWGPFFRLPYDGIKEPISAVKDTIDQLYTAVAGFAQIVSGSDQRNSDQQKSDPDPWAILCRVGGWKPEILAAVENRQGRDALRLLVIQSVLNDVYGRCENHRCLKLTAGHFEIAPAASGVAAIVSVQIAQSLTERNSSVNCAGCGCLTDPGYARTGIRRYCEVCRAKKMASRHAARAYRARKKVGGHRARKPALRSEKGEESRGNEPGSA